MAAEERLLEIVQVVANGLALTTKTRATNGGVLLGADHGKDQKCLVRGRNHSRPG